MIEIAFKTLPSGNVVWQTKSIVQYLSTRLLNSPMEFEVSEHTDQGNVRVQYRVTVRRRSSRNPGESPFIIPEDGRGTVVLLADRWVNAAWPTHSTFQNELSAIMWRALRKLRKLTGKKPPLVVLPEEQQVIGLHRL